MLSSADLRQLRIQLVADAGAAMMALLVATTLSVYKPWGMTSYGRRLDGATVRVDGGTWKSFPWTAIWLLGFVIALALFAAVHLHYGGGFNHH
jgi:hypothetical protein